jgi:hypothetical protein
MARDFWANAFVRRQLPLLADFTDVFEKHPQSTKFLERFWRRRDDAPAAGAIGCSRGLHISVSDTTLEKAAWPRATLLQLRRV